MTDCDLRSDTHVHTRLCNHARGEMEDYVRAALRRNLTRLTFLEHLEADITYPQRTWLREHDFNSYFAEGSRLQDKYKGQLTIELGVEAGYNPEAVDLLQAQLARWPFERIGLSYHFYRVGSRHYNMVSRRRENMTVLGRIGVEQVISDYLSGLVQAVQELKCDVLCHLDAVMRHHPGYCLLPSHHRQIDTLLDLMASRNISLEINTSGFSIRDTPHPSPDIIARARDRAILLTAGSDAHHPGQVGRHFRDLARLLNIGN
ncbi:histidinol-phosphatase [Desulfolithobacter sp.]